MAGTTHRIENDALVIGIEGRVDSTNASEIERQIEAIRTANPADEVVLDFENLEYISSAGLRVILRLKKAVPATRIANVTADVYEILDMTGFTEMMEVSKAYRVFSVEGCEVIGEGANGKVYRIDRDTIVKVYLNPDSLPEIHRERELARTAFVLGVPTAIPYDVVRIEGGGFGSVFELLNAASFAQLLVRGERTVDEIAEMSIELLKLIHSTVVKPESMPSMRDVVIGWVEFLADYLPADQYEKLHGLVCAVPEDNHMMHGDYHIKNVMLQNGESLLIDMDTLCHGHPVFELASMFNAYRGYSELDHSIIEGFLGITYETAGELWDKSLRLYLETDDEAVLRSVAEKAMLVGYARMMRRSIRRGGLDDESERKVIDNCASHIAELLTKIDTLLF